MRRKRSFKPFILFNTALLRDPVLLTVAMISFGAGYGIQEFFKEPGAPALIQSQEGILCQTCFTPTYHCLPLILETIQKAQKTIKIQCYSFTSKEIANALVEAHQKGIKVTVIADKSQRTDSHTQVGELARQGIDVLFDTKPAISHGKILVTDDTTVLTGSYNFTRAAEHRNAENFIIIKNKDIAQQYVQNFNQRLAVSVSN